jgi:hypothetical protein
MENKIENKIENLSLNNTINEENKEKLRCCILKICHLQCPFFNNPFCHDTKCRECNVNWLKFEENENNACMCCGYHVCKECQLTKGLLSPMEGPCPKCGM